MVDFEKRFVFTRDSFSKYNFKYNFSKKQPSTFGRSYSFDRGSYFDFSKKYFIEAGYIDFDFSYRIRSSIRSLFEFNHRVIKLDSKKDFGLTHNLLKSSYETFGFKYRNQLARTATFVSEFKFTKASRNSFAATHGFSKKKIILFSKKANITKLSFFAKEDWGMSYLFSEEKMPSTGFSEELLGFTTEAMITMVSLSDSGSFSDIVYNFFTLSFEPADTAAGFTSIDGRFTIKQHHTLSSLYQYGIEFNYKDRGEILGFLSESVPVEFAPAVLSGILSNKIIFEFNKKIIDYEDFAPDAFKLDIKPSSIRMSKAGTNIVISNHDNKYSMKDSKFYDWAVFPDLIRSDASYLEGIGFKQGFLVNSKRMIGIAGSVSNSNIATMLLGEESEYHLSGFQNTNISVSAGDKTKMLPAGSMSALMSIEAGTESAFFSLFSSTAILNFSTIEDVASREHATPIVATSVNTVMISEGSTGYISRNAVISPSPLISSIGEPGYIKQSAQGQPGGGLVIGMEFETLAGKNKIVRGTDGFLSIIVDVEISELQTDVAGFTTMISRPFIDLQDFYYEMPAHDSFDLLGMMYEASGTIVSEIVNLAGVQSVISVFQAEILYNAENILSVDVNMKVA